MKLQSGNIFFFDLGLILFHWEMFQIAWDFMCLLSGYGSCYILKRIRILRIIATKNLPENWICSCEFG